MSRQKNPETVPPDVRVTEFEWGDPNPDAKWSETLQAEAAATVEVSIPGTDVVAVASVIVGWNRLVRITEVRFTGRDVTARAMQRWPLSAVVSAVQKEAYEYSPYAYSEDWVLARPDGTDRWYRDFAGRFLRASLNTRSPAKDMAAEHGVPVSAVHRWTREARRRGFLPPDNRARKRL